MAFWHFSICQNLSSVSIVACVTTMRLLLADRRTWKPYSRQGEGEEEGEGEGEGERGGPFLFILDAMQRERRREWEHGGRE